jgi:hypothetical protein
MEHLATRKDTGTARAVDTDVINLSSDYEIRYWAARFLCSREQLIQAVAAVGRSAVSVRQYLLSTRRYF